MRRPVIGITTSLALEAGGPGRIVLDTRYVAAVEQSGGVPLVIPVLTSEAAMRDALARCEALIIPGGAGVTEGLIGSLPEDLPPTPAERTASDIWAFEASRERGMPLLGVCYGMQFINAQLGGTIYGDAEQQLQIEPHHPRRHGDRPVRHPVRVEPGTHLSRLVKGTAEVNSHHIQAIASLGRGLRVNLQSEDGLIEGFESEDGAIVGVQFHPERMPGTVWDGLFRDLLARAGLQPGSFRNL